MTILELLSDAWAIKPSHLEMLQRLYAERKERRLSAAELKDVELAIGRPLNNNAEKPYQVLNGVAVIPVMGSIAKRGSMFSDVSGLTSYEAIQRNLRQAETDPEVIAALLNIDSPGGTANGTATAAEAIRRFATVKPIGAWTDGMMTSAAQWLGAATGDVQIGNDTTELGSIGVISRHVDVSKAEEMDGIKTTVLTAGRYKGAGHPYAPLSAEHQGVLQERLDYLYSAFVNAMAGYREKSPEQVLASMADGRIFTGRQAIDVGLADGMMGFDEMVEHMRQRAKGAKPMDMNRKQVSATGGKALAEISHGGKRMTKSELKQLHPALYAEVFAEGQASGGPMCGTCSCKDCGGGECSCCSKNPHKMSADTERARIQGVLALPGAAATAHKDLLQSLAFDGKTTAEGAAHQVLLAEETLRQQAVKDIAEGAAKPAPAAEEGAGGGDKAAEAKSLSAKMIAQANAGR
jgi:Periplasmic serine proteases (ClpP class)